MGIEGSIPPAVCFVLLFFRYFDLRCGPKTTRSAFRVLLSSTQLCSILLLLLSLIHNARFTASEVSDDLGERGRERERQGRQGREQSRAEFEISFAYLCSSYQFDCDRKGQIIIFYPSCEWP